MMTLQSELGCISFTTIPEKTVNIQYDGSLPVTQNSSLKLASLSAFGLGVIKYKYNLLNTCSIFKLPISFCVNFGRLYLEGLVSFTYVIKIVVRE